MTRKDLEAAGIPFRTKDGDVDFHAAGRHSYITGLLRNGTSLVVARELARHSDVKMTMRYTHIGLEDQAKGIQNLPTDPKWLSSRRPTESASQQIGRLRGTFRVGNKRAGTSCGLRSRFQLEREVW